MKGFIVLVTKAAQLWRIYENLKLAVEQCYRSTGVDNFNMTKVGGKCQNEKNQMRHFEKSNIMKCNLRLSLDDVFNID